MSNVSYEKHMRHLTEVQDALHRIHTALTEANVEFEFDARRWGGCFYTNNRSAGVFYDPNARRAGPYVYTRNSDHVGRDYTYKHGVGAAIDFLLRRKHRREQ